MPLLFLIIIITILLLHFKSTEELIHPQLRSVPLAEVRNQDELNTNYWVDKAQETIARKLKTLNTLNEQKAKNIIMFMGDGMSVHTLTATRAFIKDVSTELSFDKFPYFGLSRTYCVDKQVPDSASTATAYLSGVKGNYGTIGVNAKVHRFNCTVMSDKTTRTESIASWAQKAKKSTGLVTTARVTHASPAGVYAHTANRQWENDFKVKANNCSTEVNPDIAVQLLENPEGRNLKVVLGGGRAQFRDVNASDEEGKPGYRTDGRDLIKEWLEIQRDYGRTSKYVWSRKALQNLNTEKTDYLLGLFTPDHIPFHGDRRRQHLEDSIPSLTEMTVAAIKMLKKEKNGYFLFVEGARIDMAHHETKARKALEETEEFANAVQTARNMTSEEDTLIIVTSDHSHTMTINGYPVSTYSVSELLYIVFLNHPLSSQETQTFSN